MVEESGVHGFLFPAPSLDKRNTQELESHLSVPYVNVATMHKASHIFNNSSKWKHLSLLDNQCC